jgi:hypothetical protein
MEWLPVLRARKSFHRVFEVFLVAVAVDREGGVEVGVPEGLWGSIDPGRSSQLGWEGVAGAVHVESRGCSA